MRSHKKATNNTQLKESLVGMSWCLKSLNDDEDLDKKIEERFDAFEKMRNTKNGIPRRHCSKTL